MCMWHTHGGTPADVGGKGEFRRVRAVGAVMCEREVVRATRER